MNDDNPVSYVQVMFAHITIRLMMTVGSLLEASVRTTPPLPPEYEGIWDSFFERIAVLISAAARRIEVPVPELAQALSEIKGGIRELYGIVSARTHARDETVSEAAQTLLAEFFPEGLEVVTQSRPKVLGWMFVNVAKLEMSYPTEIGQVRAETEVAGLRGALDAYAQIMGRWEGPGTVETSKSLRVLRDEARHELRGVMIELAHLCKRYPKYIPVVKGMLRPLDELMSEVRAEKRKKGKSKPATPAEEANDESAEDTAPAATASV